VAAPWGGFLFLANDGTHGRELWSTDGTAAGTHLVKDILPGAGDSYPLGLTVLNGAVYFHASGPEGDELWRTDGTEAGTTLVKNINPGSSGSNPIEITRVGNQLFFLAYDPTAGTPLWRSDGTAAGTVPLHSSEPITFCCIAPGYIRFGFSDVAGQLMFLAGTNLWRSDGTDAGTVRVADIGSAAAIPMRDGYAVAGGGFYLRGGPQGEEVWRSDGTDAGTARILSGPALTSSFYLEGGAASSREGFAELNGEVCFAGYDGSAAWSELWKSDGTAAGTVKIDTNMSPGQLRSVNGRVVFLTNAYLWSTDGTPGGGQSLSAETLELTRTGDAVYFRLGAVGGIYGEPWKTDGTPEGTGQFADIVPGSPSSDPRFFTAAGGKLFLQATDGAGAELWVSDGTSAGTSQVADLEPGAASSSPQDLTGAGGLLFFTADTSGSGRELWKSDGTGAGTVMVKDIQPGTASSFPSSGVAGTFAAPAGGPLFFAADDGADGEELWKSAGTGAGTVMLKDILEGGIGSQPRSLTVVGNRVFFVADDFDHGRELWVSDGTPAGTRLVKDLVPGPGSSLPYNLTVAGSVLVFSAFDEAHGVEAWRSDGTALGTRRLGDLAHGTLPSSPFGYTVAGSNLFFAANDNATGFELWAVPTPSVQSIFADVPTTYWAWRFVEALARSGVSSGCGDGDFCPGAYVNRAQMAIFVLTARGTAPPPATGTRFDDVPPGYWAGPWIEELAREGVVSGCSANPPRYCPNDLLTRAEMAVLLTVARHETPPPATGTRFADVPADYWAARFIEQLAADGITSGCGGGNFCPDQPITRGEMAVFLATAFHLPLP
ncbi:MAG: ELWxxDGT repeat protein, partial [Thermoanaerobaculia bacterium]